MSEPSGKPRYPRGGAAVWTDGSGASLLLVDEFFGAPAAGVDELDATGVDTSAPSVDSPALGQAHALTATDVATDAPTVGNPSVGQAFALTATGVSTGAPSVGGPILTQQEAPAQSGGGGGGGGGGERRRPSVPRYRRFRLSDELRRELEGRNEPEPEPIEDLEAEIEEEAEERYAEQVISEALADFGGLSQPDQWIAKVPSSPPRPVVEAIVAAPDVRQWSSIIEAIREAQRRAATKAEQESVARYRREVEAIRARIAKAIQDEQEIEWMMAEGWL